MKKSFVVSTGFWGGLFLLLTMILLPSYSFYSSIRAPFHQFVKEAGQAYSQLGVPSIAYKNGEAHSNNDQLFSKTFTDERGKDFSVCIDTGPNPDLTLVQKIRGGMGGVVLYRDRLIFYDADKMQERTVPFTQFGDKFSFTLDDRKVAELSGTLGQWVLLGIVSMAFCFFGAGKIFWWLVFALIHSGKAEKCGGGNYSLGLWILAPATLYQTFASVAPPCGCGLYYLILFLSAWFLGRFLVPLPPKED